jgi:predicted nucleic acid-binding protein
MSYLVDANVLCEATRRQPDPHVLAWLERHDAELHISVLTLAEILKGVRLLVPGKKRQQLERWFEELTACFEGRILPVDEAVARTWAEFYARQQQQGRLLSSFDSLLAATAMTHELTLATRNTADFPKEVSVVNPWLASSDA